MPETVTARLPHETLESLDQVSRKDAHTYLPSPILAELVRGYRRYVAIAFPDSPDGSARAASPTPETSE